MVLGNHSSEKRHVMKAKKILCNYNAAWVCLIHENYQKSGSKPEIHENALQNNKFKIDTKGREK